MEVRFLPQVYQNYNRNTNYRQYNNSNITAPKLQGLCADTVSFGIKLPHKPAVTTFKEFLAAGYRKKIPTYQILSKKFNLALGSIATKLESYGVHFDLEYCSLNSVKGEIAYLSKFKRSGAEPLDKIRSTMYMDDPYDMNILANYILPELREFGYEIIGFQKPTKRRAKVPDIDFDIRLNPAKIKNVEMLDEPLRGLISGPQKSGYEDIQIRLLDTTAAAPNQVPHELLILFGENTAKAKHDESYYVFDITRELANMHIMEMANGDNASPIAVNAKEAFSLIRSKLNTNISKPLFFNAKKLDYEQDASIQVPPELSAITVQSIKALMNCLSEGTRKYYKLEADRIGSKEYLPTIRKLIRQSEDFKTREDKHISSADIAEKREELLNALTEKRQEDLKTITEARARLRKTIETFGEKSSSDAKPE